MFSRCSKLCICVKFLNRCAAGIVNVISFRVVKILALVLIQMTMGMFLEIPGPTMIDIKLLFNASYEEVSRSISGRGAGGFTGAIIGGILVDKFEHSLDLFIGISESLAAMAIFSVPYTLSINTLWFHYFTLGACGGILNIGGIRSVILLWVEKTGVTLQLLSVGYGIGALLVPLFVNPYLAVLKYPKHMAKNHEADLYKVVKQTHVPIAFETIGIVSLVLSFVFYYFHFRQPHTLGFKQLPTESRVIAKSKSFKDMLNPATYANGQFYYGFYVLAVLFIYYFCLVGGEEVFGNFVRSFSVDVFKFNRNQASYLNMTFWLSLTTGGLFWTLISSYLPLRRLFMLQVILHTCSTTVLRMYASTSTTMLWVCTVTEGLLRSPLFAGGIAYCNTLIDVTGMCLMVIQFSGSLGDLIFIWTAGKLYDIYGPKSLLYGLQLVGIVILFCAVLFRIGERSKKMSSVVEIHVNQEIHLI